MQRFCEKRKYVYAMCTYSNWASILHTTVAGWVAAFKVYCTEVSLYFCMYHNLLLLLVISTSVVKKNLYYAWEARIKGWGKREENSTEIFWAIFVFIKSRPTFFSSSSSCPKQLYGKVTVAASSWGHFLERRKGGDERRKRRRRKKGVSDEWGGPLLLLLLLLLLLRLRWDVI